MDATPDHQIGMSLAIADSLSKQIGAEDEILTVHFSGGEPFAYMDAMALAIDNLVSREKSIIISTGCSEFTSLAAVEQLFSQLKRVDRLWVSFDSFHLENVPIENFRYLNDYVKNHASIKVGYSICYRSIKEYASTLLEIQREGFIYDSIIKQPVVDFGRGKRLVPYPQTLSNNIPDDFKCSEVSLANIWPDGTVTNCGIFAGRNPGIKRFDTLRSFLDGNSGDVFSVIRSKYSLKEINQKFGICTTVNTLAPCTVCKSFLENGMLKTIYEETAET